MENRKKLSDEELDRVSGGTITDSQISYMYFFIHADPKCNANFAAASKPEKCPVCHQPDTPEFPIKLV